MLARISAAALLAIVALAVLGALQMLTVGSAPDEKQLKAVTGALEQVHVGSGKDGGAEFLVRPPGKEPLSLHMQSFGRGDLARQILAAQGQTVTVRYKAAPLGNPAFELVAENGPLLTYADAAAYLKQEDKKIGPPLLLLYVGLPVAMLIIMRARRHGKRPSRTVQRGAPPLMTLTKAQAGASIFGVIVAVLAALLMWSLWTDPAMLRPFVGVFGPEPLGLPPRVGASLVLLAGLTPLLVAMYHAIHFLSRLHAATGELPAGSLRILWAVIAHWSLINADAELRSHGRWILAALAAFVLLCGAWIWTAARAGV